MVAGEDDQATGPLEYRLAVAEETLRALLAGSVDAIVMDAERGEQRVYTLETVGGPYRRLVEQMFEGADRGLGAADSIERHGGVIWVASTFGSGTAVSFTAPIRHTRRRGDRQAA